MKHRYHLGRKLVALMLVLFMFASTAFAAELRIDSPDGLALGAEVFSESEAQETQEYSLYFRVCNEVLR